MSHEHPHPPRSDGSPAEAPPLGPRAWWADPDEPPGMWDKKKNVDRLLRVFFVLSALLVVLDLVVHREVHHSWESVVGFHAWYGFAAFWILVAAAKRIRRVLMRSEDYYDVD